MSNILPHLRRLYLHALNGGTVTPDDLSRVIALLEAPGSPTDASDPLGLVGLGRDVDALLPRSGGCTCPPDDAPTPCPRKHALQDCLAAVEMCECGAMSAVNCGSMPSRHCGMWDYTEDELRDMDT